MGLLWGRGFRGSGDRRCKQWSRDGAPSGICGHVIGMGHVGPTESTHVRWGEVGGVLEGLVAAVAAVAAAESAALGRSARLTPPPLSPAFFPFAPLALGWFCPHSRVSLRVCAGAAGSTSPAGWAAEPGSARARPWRAVARGAVVLGRRR